VRQRSRDLDTFQPRVFGIDLFSYAEDGKALAAIAGESERA
jgi:hypothetical protein